ncbi:uncharacterized protein Dwil_GK16208 [Drosophila willistoni]|uniref:Uncharacterized protein n=1 Tax=Drosophila willistoni TaxID=7260 RepID=B4NPY1_DROWI|nr:uncharacterized protein Dwil_GK16208 [Drosophila willistoni]
MQLQLQLVGLLSFGIVALSLSSPEKIHRQVYDIYLRRCQELISKPMQVDEMLDPEFLTKWQLIYQIAQLKEPLPDEALSNIVNLLSVTQLAFNDFVLYKRAKSDSEKTTGINYHDYLSSGSKSYQERTSDTNTRHYLSPLSVHVSRGKSPGSNSRQERTTGIDSRHYLSPLSVHVSHGKSPGSKSHQERTADTNTRHYLSPLSVHVSRGKSPGSKSHQERTADTNTRHYLSPLSVHTPAQSQTQTQTQSQSVAE